jgi:ABC-2 type transport system permease protein
MVSLRERNWYNANHNNRWSLVAASACAMFILSGFSFPISSMPDAFQWLTYLYRLRNFLIIIRATYLKVAGIDLLWPPMASLAWIGFALFSLAVLRFRNSLDRRG